MTLAIPKSAFTDEIINIVKEIYVLKTIHCFEFFILETFAFQFKEIV